MKTLRIEIDEAGFIRVSVDGEPIGLIEELKLRAGSSGKPRVDLTFYGLNKAAEGQEEARQKLLENLERYHQLLEGMSFVEVFDRADTLPTGMPAVRTED